MDADQIYKTIKEKFGEQISEVEEAILLHRMMKFRDEIVLGFRNVDDVINAVCERYEIKKEALPGNSRLRKFVEARQIIWWILKRTDVCDTMIPLIYMGGMFGRKHTTAIHGIRSMDKLVQTNQEIRERITTILSRFGRFCQWDPTGKRFLIDGKPVRFEEQEVK